MLNCAEGTGRTEEGMQMEGKETGKRRGVDGWEEKEGEQRGGNRMEER